MSRQGRWRKLIGARGICHRMYTPCICCCPFTAGAAEEDGTLHISFAISTKKSGVSEVLMYSVGYPKRVDLIKVEIET